MVLAFGVSPRSPSQPFVSHSAYPDEPDSLLLAYATSRDPRLRSELVTAYDGFARALARGFPSRRETPEDLVQVARLGLLNAIDRFDPAHGRPFKAFARATILGELKRHIRDHTWSMRVPRSLKEHYVDVIRAVDDLEQELSRSPRIPEVAARTGLSEEEVLEAMEVGVCHRTMPLGVSTGDRDTVIDPGRPDDRFGDVEQQWFVSHLLSKLDDVDRDLVRMRFVEGLSQSQIATRLGKSQMHVSRRLTKTFLRMRGLSQAS